MTTDSISDCPLPRCNSWEVRRGSPACDRPSPAGLRVRVRATTSSSSSRTGNRPVGRALGKQPHSPRRSVRTVTSRRLGTAAREPSEEAATFRRVVDLKPPRLAAGGERETLRALTRYHRESVVRKLDGLTEDQARQELVPSGTSLLWIVKHLTKAEGLWVYRRGAAGERPLP